MSWFDFLGTQKQIQNKEYMTFKKAYLWLRKVNKKNRIKNKKDFESYAKASIPFQPLKTISKGRFKGLRAISLKIPIEPEIYYREEWVNWNYFLLNKKKGVSFFKVYGLWKCQKVC